jgi:predicted TPR repeat methyltransferase
MTNHNTLKLVNDFASGYDAYIQNCSWDGPDILFEQMHDFVLSNQKLLDIGIGTGLSAIPFKNAGLQIYGLDGSEEMLRICQLKGFTEDLKWVNLAEPSIPYPFKFDHIISYAVFHFLADLDLLFHQVSNSLKPDGIFGFSIDQHNPMQPDNFIETSVTGVYKRKNPDSGLEVFQHSEGYVQKILQNTGFKILNKSKILAFKDPESSRQVFFNLYVTQKVKTG